MSTCVVHFREECTQLINEMSREIGKINIYDIYQPCFINMGTSATRARYIHYIASFPGRFKAVEKRFSAALNRPGNEANTLH